MADGDARLIIELEAKIDKLTDGLSKANRAMYGFSSAASKNIKSLDDSWSRMFGKADPGKAIDKVFDRSRLGLLQAGSSQLRIFGSALEPLGTAGLLAAGAVAALGIAVHEAIKAGDWAEQLKATAKEIGLTTTALQEYDAVALSSGVATDVMQESLKGLNEKIGIAQGGGPLAKRAQHVFDELQIKPEQLRDLGTLQNILPVIADKLRALPASQREGLAAKLNIAPILPALLEGSAGIKKITDAAQESGRVLGPELIDKGAEAARQMKIAADAVDKNLKGAFIDLEPAIAAATNALAGFIHMFADLGGREIRTIENLGQAFVDFGKGRYQAELDDIRHARFSAFGPGADKAEPVGPISSASDLHSAILGLSDSGPAKVTALASDKAPRGPRGPHDDTDEQLKSANDAAAEAAKALAEAQKGLTENIQARAAAEIAANNDEAAKKRADLAAQLKKLLADKGIEGKDSDAAQANLEKAQADVEAARIAKNQAIQRAADFKLEDQQIETSRLLFDAKIEELKAQAEITSNMALRRDLEKQILKLTQQRAQDELGAKLDRDVVTGQLTPAEAQQRAHAQAISQGAESQTQANSQFLAANPLAAFANQANETYGNLDTDLQNAAVRGIEAFNQGIANAITNFKSLKEVGTEVLKALEQSLITSLLNKVEGSLLSWMFGAIGLGPGGAAAGSPAAFSSTPFADGGRIVGEGTGRSDSILASVSHGEYIVNAAATKKNLALLQAINSGRIGRFANGGLLGSARGLDVSAMKGGSATIPSTHYYDLRGAMVDKDVFAQMQAMSAAAEERAVGRALAGARMAFPGVARSHSLLVA